MNLVVVQGRPTRDAMLQYGKTSGTRYVRFFLAIPTPFRNNAEKKATFIPVVCFGQLADRMASYLKKGAFCSVVGRLMNDPEKDELGQWHDRITIYANSVEIHQRVGGASELRGLTEGYQSEDVILPHNIDDSLFRQIDLNDEDMPNTPIRRSKVDEMF